MLLRDVAVTDDRAQAAAIEAVRATETPGRMPQTRTGPHPIGIPVRFDPLAPCAPSGPESGCLGPALYPGDFGNVTGIMGSLCTGCPRKGRYPNHQFPF